MGGYKSTINCTVVKADDTFKKCVDELDIEACVERLGEDTVLPLCSKKETWQKTSRCIDEYLSRSELKLDPWKCDPDQDRSYFKLSYEGFALCDSKSPKYLADVTSTNESYECSVAPVPANITDFPESHDFVLRNGPNVLNGYCNRHFSWSYGAKCIVQNNRGESVHVDMPEMRTVIEKGNGNVDATRRAYVQAPIDAASPGLLKKFGAMADAILARGLDSLGVDKLTSEELKKEATCNAGEICGNRVSQAGALLDAVRVKKYISGKTQQAKRGSGVSLTE